jgi:hypothetical protein
MGRDRGGADNDILSGPRTTAATRRGLAARRIDICEENRLLAGSGNLNDFRHLRFIQSHDGGEAITHRVESNNLLGPEPYQFRGISRPENARRYGRCECPDGQTTHRGKLDALLDQSKRSPNAGCKNASS